MIKIIGFICLVVAFVLAITTIIIDENCQESRKKEVVIDIFGVILVLCALTGFGLIAWRG